MKSLGLVTAALLVLLMSGAAQASVVYAGSWEVISGPNWRDQPLAYTGQQAAALLFGGNAGDYEISTVGSDPTLIDRNAWYSVIGYGGPNNGGIMYSEDHVATASTQTGGLYYSGGGYNGGDPEEAASAYVADNAGSGNVNYAFQVTDVPEPASLALLGGAVLSVGILRRRKT